MATTPSAADAKEAYAEAQALAARVGTTEYQQKLAEHTYNWAYQQAWGAVDRLAANPTIAKIRQVGDAGAVLTGQGLKLYGGFRSGKFTADAGGVIDASMAFAKFTESFGKVLSAVGVDDTVVREVVGWSGVAAGCGAGIAAGTTAGVGGTIVGAVACAFSFVGKLFESLSAAQYYLPAHEPRSVFAPNPDSQPIIAADAFRLAHVLRHHYGITSYRELYNRVDSRPTMEWLTARYPREPPQGVQAKTPSAHNLRTILQMLDRESGSAAAANRNVGTGLAALAGYRSGLDPAGRSLYMRYDSDHDINVAAVESAAYFARGSIAATGSPRVAFKIHNGGDISNWMERMSSADVQPNLAPFLRVDELNNYFAAVTATELGRGDPINEVYLKHFGRYNPVKLSFVDNVTRDGQNPKRFSPSCWTNLRRAGIAICEDDVYEPLHSISPPAALLKEFGSMRLMAAFSYMHLTYMWSEKRSDMIADIPAVQNEQDLFLRVPVDPRQATPSGSVWKLEGPDAINALKHPTTFGLGRTNGMNMGVVMSPIKGVAKPAAGRAHVASYNGVKFLFDQVRLRDDVAQQAALAASTRANTQILRISSGLESILHGKTANQAMHTILTDPRWSAQLRLNLQTQLRPTTNLGPALIAGAAALLAFKFFK